MIARIFPGILASLFLAVSAGPAAADTLTLRSGERLDGIFVGASGDIVYLRVEGNIRQFSIDEVASIGFDQTRDARRGLDAADQSTGRAIIVGAGALISVAFSEKILAGDLREGQVFRTKLARHFKSGDTLLAPAGSDVYGAIVRHESGGVGMVLTELAVAGERVSIRTETRRLPQAGEPLEQVDFRVGRPFTLRIATFR